MFTFTDSSTQSVSKRYSLRYAPASVIGRFMMQRPDRTHCLPLYSLVYDGVIPVLTTVSSSTTAIADSMVPGWKYSMKRSTTSVVRSGRSEGHVRT